MIEFGEISEEGKFIPMDKEGFKRSIHRYKGKKVTLEIKQATNRRTGQQNKLYWKNVHILAEHSGYSPEDLHNILKIMTFGYEVQEYNGIEFQTVSTSRDKDTKEFSRLFDTLLREMKNQDLIPILPNDI